jgi:hypothetical protein
MPFLEERYWPPARQALLRATWNSTRQSLVKGEEANAALWRTIFVDGQNGSSLPAACRSALFIMLYRDEPIFQQPFRFLELPCWTSTRAWPLGAADTSTWYTA